MDASIFALVQSYASPPKRQGLDFDVHDILAVLHGGGVPCSLRRLYKVIKGLGLGKNDAGFYGKAEVAVVIGWMQQRHQYSSFGQYVATAGGKIYQHAKAVYREA